MIKKIFFALMVLNCTVNAQQKTKVYPLLPANASTAKTALMPIPSSTLYTFSTFTAAYQTITGTSVTNGLKWDEPEHTISLGFPFKLYNKTASTFNGGSYVTDDNAAPLLTAASPFFEDLCDRSYTSSSNEGDPGGVSPITYTVSGTVGNRIARIQISNAGFYGEIGTATLNPSFTNFQIWLYETSNIIEFRFGPTSISNLASNFTLGSQGFICGLFEDCDFTNSPNNSNMLNGSVGSPTQTGFDLSNIPSTIPSITGQNNLNGRVYRFTYNGLSTRIAFNELNEVFTVYPNPVKEYITIKSNNANNINQVSVCDLNGKVILSEKAETINLTNLVAGIYLLKIETNNGIYFKKLTKSE
jgi:hypothetical protein